MCEMGTRTFRAQCFYPPVDLFVSLCYLSTSLSVCLPTYLSIYLSIDLPICLPIYPGRPYISLTLSLSLSFCPREAIYRRKVLSPEFHSQRLPVFVFQTAETLATIIPPGSRDPPLQSTPGEAGGGEL